MGMMTNIQTWRDIMARNDDDDEEYYSHFAGDKVEEMTRDNPQR